MMILAVLTVCGGSGERIQCQETTVTFLTVLAVSAVVAASVVTSTPLNLNPPFPSS